MQERFYSFVTSLIDPSAKLLLAISGGLDSVTLLDLAHKSKLNCSVAHVNFQLRGIESDEDEAFVKALAMSHQFQYFSTKFNTDRESVDSGLSTQMIARKLRYDWFDKIMKEEDFDFLLTAHHLNDNLETALLNFTRGTGLSGMRGMEIINQRIVRPLLIFTRLEVETYVKEHQLKWREDSSNKSIDYKRNFIRHNIIPKLKEINPSLENTFRSNATRFLGEEELINFAVEQIEAKNISKEGSLVKIEKALFNSFKNKAAVLWRLLKDFGFNLDQCESIISGIDGQSGKLFYSDQFTLTIDRECLIIAENRTEESPVEITERDEYIVTKGAEISITTSNVWQISNDKCIGMFDRGKLKFPMVLRHWKEGDYFYPLGMNHKKKISDFLIDLKLSLADKNQVLVIETDGSIAWVVGYRVDDRFKITPQTKTALSFKITS